MTVVAIDGPAGAGKSTIAAALAERLGVPHVDTGAYYRAATVAVLRAGVDPENGAGCAAVVAGIRVERRAGRTYLDGEDVEAEIRGPAVTAAVSAVSVHPAVRATLLGMQRAEVGSAGAVVEGRDAGTVVVPGADLKVWLTASPRQRAARRAAQLGDGGAVDEHALDLLRRDRRDSAQMRPAPEAVVVDTGERSVESIVEELAAVALGASAANSARGGPRR